MTDRPGCLPVPQRLAIGGCFLLIAWFFLSLASPASLWMVVPKMNIESAVVGQPIVVDYERDIHRSFAADRTARIDKAVPGGWAEVCLATERRRYRPNEDLNRPVYLTRFVAPDCANQPAGDYRLTIRWSINPTGLRAALFGRSIEVTDRYSVVEAVP